MKIGLLACIYTNMSSYKIMDNIVIIPLKNNDPSQLVCRSHVISREQCFTAPQQSLALPLNFSKGDGIGSPFVAERAFSNYCQYFDQLVESVCTNICTPQKLYFSEKAKNIPVLQKMSKKYLEDSLTACLFNYTRAVSFPLGPMIAIIMGFCPSHKIPSH